MMCFGRESKAKQSTATPPPPIPQTRMMHAHPLTLPSPHRPPQILTHRSIPRTGPSTHRPTPTPQPSQKQTNKHTHKPFSAPHPCFSAANMFCIYHLPPRANTCTPRFFDFFLEQSSQSGPHPLLLLGSSTGLCILYYIFYASQSRSFISYIHYVILKFSTLIHTHYLFFFLIVIMITIIIMIIVFHYLSRIHIYYIINILFSLSSLSSLSYNKDGKGDGFYLRSVRFFFSFFLSFFLSFSFISISSLSLL